MSIFARHERQQPPLSPVAAVFGIIASLLIALPSDNSGLIVIGFLLLVPCVLLEPINAVLILLIIAPLKALIAAEAPGLVPGDIGQLGLVLVGIAWLVNSAVYRRPLRLEISWVQLPLAVFLCAVLLSLPGAISLNAAIFETVKWIEMGLMISICLMIFGKRNIQWLVFALVLAGVVQAVSGIYQFFGGSGAEHLQIIDGFHYRAFGTFGQPNPFGAFMGITLPLAVMSTMGYGLEVWHAVRRGENPNAALRSTHWLTTLITALFYLAASGLIGGALLASWSRGAWMGFAGAAVVMLFFIPKSLFKSIVLVLGLVTIVGLAWFQGLVPATISARMVGFVSELTSVTDVRGAYVTDENYAITERIAHWQAAEWMTRDHPWTGVGFDNYEVAYPQYALMEWQNPLGHAHNYYLNLLAETGILGLLAYVGMWLGIVAITVHKWQTATGLDRAWCIGLLGIWAYIAIHSLVDKLYVNNIFLHIGCMFGLLAIMLVPSGDPTE